MPIITITCSWKHLQNMKTVSTRYDIIHCLSLSIHKAYRAIYPFVVTRSCHLANKVDCYVLHCTTECKLSCNVCYFCMKP